MVPSRITTLVVESDLRRSTQLAQLLRDSTQPVIQPTFVSTLSEALEQLERERYDAVICRLRLPGTRGLEPLLRLQAINDTTPIVALLESGEKELLCEAAESLSDDCLHFDRLDAERLSQALALAIDRREMLRDLRERRAAGPAGRGPFRALLNHFDEAVFLLSLSTGELLFHNEVAQRWFGDGLQAQVEELKAYGALEGEELEVEVATGNRFIPNAELRSVRLQWQGRPCCMISLRNISKRKRAEAAYKASQRRLELALKASKVGMWSWDLRERRLRVSEEWKAQLGYAYHEFPDSLAAFRAALHPEDRRDAARRFHQLLRGTRSSFEGRLRLRHAQGRYRVIHCRAEILTDTDGSRAMVLGTHVDVTERLIQEADEEREDRLEYAQPDPAVAEPIAQRLAEAARSLEREASSIRDHFRGDSLIAMRILELERKTRQVAALSALLRTGPSNRIGRRSREETVEFLQALLPRQVEVRCDCATDADWELLVEDGQRARLGLALSAVGERAPRDYRSVLWLRSRSRSASDGGPYMEIDYEGSMLDSSALANLAKLEGLTLQASSHGDRSVLRLRASSIAEPRLSLLRSGRPSARPLALLAEDEGILNMAVRSMLDSLGYEVVVAQDGAEAVQRFQEQPQAFTLALIDRHMPGLCGRKVVRAIRLDRPDLPVIHMSGDGADEGGAELADEDPRSWFLPKPFGIAQLRETLEVLREPRTASV